MSAAIIRLNKFNAMRVATMRDFKNALQHLERATDDAIKQQVYAVKNPDDIIEEEFFDDLVEGVEELIPEFIRVAGKIEAIIKTVRKEMLVDDLHLNHDFSLMDYSKQLLR